MSEPPRISPPVSARPPPARPSSTPEERSRFSDLLRQRSGRSAASATSAPDPSEHGLDSVPADPLLPPPLPKRTVRDTAEPYPSSNREAAADERRPDEGGRTERLRAAGISPEGHAVVSRLAHTITSFCNDPAVSTSEGWQVRMQLRPDVLPETTLGLTISPHWLSLRFEIHDERSRLLVSQHQSELIRRLEDSLARQRDISIDFDPGSIP